METTLFQNKRRSSTTYSNLRWIVSSSLYIMRFFMDNSNLIPSSACIINFSSQNVAPSLTVWISLIHLNWVKLFLEIGSCFILNLMFYYFRHISLKELNYRLKQILFHLCIPWLRGTSNRNFHCSITNNTAWPIMLFLW